MMPVSDVNTGAPQPLTAVGKARGTARYSKNGEETQGRPLKPVMDEYVPEERREPSGRYWLGKDEDGRPKIYFDGPEQAADASGAEKPGHDKVAKGPEEGGKKEELCVCNTGRVDREIETLKRKRQELEQQFNTETDGVRGRDLKRQLAQVERELSTKDNDTYRKQHSTFTNIPSA